MPTAVIVGASTGIGLALARRLTAQGWSVTGLARSAAGFEHERYAHVIADVRAANYRDILATLRVPDVCVYSTGIGHELDFAQITRESDVFTTNLTGAVITAEVFLPKMVDARAGHFIGISSLADRMLNKDAPSYSASKAGMSSYLESLALACRPYNVAVTNVRFGFVDTAMAKAPGGKPFMVTADRAAQVLQSCIRRRPIRKSFPWRMAAAVWLIRWPSRIRIWFS
ncbi:MAG: SDR family NAD(P)-dependent oxidoreductase [Myxococcota bacterium]|nr:SDR family NAD(P)-dependent oxidoreductase [Myxococcota bacterium]